MDYKVEKARGSRLLRQLQEKYGLTVKKPAFHGYQIIFNKCGWSWPTKLYFVSKNRLCLWLFLAFIIYLFVYKLQLSSLFAILNFSYGRWCSAWRVVFSTKNADASGWIGMQGWVSGSGSRKAKTPFKRSLHNPHLSPGGLNFNESIMPLWLYEEV